MFIINSVVQYFSSIKYLLRVLEGALNAVKPGGRIFIGDIRSLPLLEAYHTSIELYQTTDTCSLEELQKRARQRLDQDNELVIDPAFFAALKQHFPRIKHVQIQPKQGDYRNEFSKFRYEAILHLSPSPAEESSAPVSEISWQDWQKKKPNLADIRNQLIETQPMSFGLRGVPNGRVQAEVNTLETFHDLAGMPTVVELRASLLNSESSWIAPEELWALSSELPYSVEISWSQGLTDGSYDVVFRHNSITGEVIFEEPSGLRLWDGYGNMPLQGKLAQRLVSNLGVSLAQKLPEYMVPSFFMLLEEVPLTPNGKIDHKALPQPDLKRRQESNLVLPRNSVELQLASIWEEILNVHPVGVQDNFFELGGHSLLAIGLMAKIEQCLEKSLSLAKLFQNPTIEQLANIILSQSPDHLNWSPLVAIQPNGSKSPFFCVPGSAMDVIEFYYLAHHLGSDQLFYGLQPRGLDGKLEPHTQIEDMAACHIEALQTVQPIGPYYLGGHSFGVHTAFEMAQQLIEHGHKVAFLAIMDTPVPTPILENPADFEESAALALTGFVELLEIFLKRKVELSQDKLLSLALNGQLEYISNQLELDNLISMQVGKEQLQGYLKVSRADEKALALYLRKNDIVRNIHPTKITLFRALDQTESSEIEKDNSWGWNDFSIRPVGINFVPGDHATMMTEPHVITLAKQLRNRIDKTQNGEA